MLENLNVRQMCQTHLVLLLSNGRCALCDEIARNVVARLKGGYIT